MDRERRAAGAPCREPCAARESLVRWGTGNGSVQQSWVCWSDPLQSGAGSGADVDGLAQLVREFGGQ